MRNPARWAIAACVAAAAALAAPVHAEPRAAEYFMYVGTYTENAGKGIYAYRFNPDGGHLTPMGLVAEATNPTFLVVHPSGRFLYAVNEHEVPDTPGQHNRVSAYAVNRTTGALTFLNTVSSRGEGPCHISIDHAGKAVLVANYRSGSIAALPILADGRLGEATAFDQHADGPNGVKAHIHFVGPSPDDRFALAVDPPLGRVFVYRFDAAKGTLTANDPPFVELKKGLSPRHLTFGPTGKYVYVNGDRGSSVTTFAYQADTGTLKELQTVSTLPPGATGENSSSEIFTDKTGRFLYVSNRGHETIAMFAINQTDGTLTPTGHASTGGKRPRFFTIDPSGQFLMVGNHTTGTVVVNRIDSKTGRLSPVQTLTDMPAPVCIVFVPAE